MLGIKDEGYPQFAKFEYEEVNHIKLYRPRSSQRLLPVHHITDGGYLPALTLHEIIEGLQKIGIHTFKQYDKSTIVNKSRIKKEWRIDKNTILVEFVDSSTTYVSGRSRYR